MTTLRERVGGLILGEDISRARAVRDTVSELGKIARAEVIRSPDEMLGLIAELDPQLVDMFRSLNSYEFVGTHGTQGFQVETARKAAVTEANWMYDQDVISQYTINLWTDFGFGLSVEVVPRDEQAQEVWSEFWEADRNSIVLGERQLHALSTDVLNEGEVFLSITTSTMDGKSTVRVVPSLEITDIIKDPLDGVTPIFYKRQCKLSLDGDYSVIYYPDWRITRDEQDRVASELQLGQGSGEVFASNVNDATAVTMLPVMHRQRYGRGWPLLKNGFRWNRTYRSFLQDRAAIEKAAAAYLDKVKLKKGGSRAVDELKTFLSSTLSTSDHYTDRNPPPAAGAAWLENEQLERTRMPQGTGATDAETDGAMLLAQVGLAGSIYPHYLGRGEAFRLATATAMETPVFRAFNRYRNFWSSVWRDLGRIVLSSAAEYNSGLTYDDITVDVAQDAILSQSTEALTSATNVLTSAYDRGILEPDVAELATEQVLKTALAMLGIRNVDDIINPPEVEGDDGLPPEPTVEEVRLLNELRAVVDYHALARSE